MGDFLGFKFGGFHSSDLGITRVSDGDRYKNTLHPEVKDRTAEVTGLDGEYYFGSDFGHRTFDIDIAFDALTEDQLRNLKRIFGTKQIQQLIFDECPYKKYMVKIEDPIELSYVCFDEPIKRVVGTAIGDERYGVRKVEEVVSETIVDEETGEESTIETTVRVPERIYPYETLSQTHRVYKGEGNITFIAYFPFAKSNFKVLPEQNDDYYEGSDSWAFSSGILSAEERTAKAIDEYHDGVINVYNGGDVATGFRLYCPGSPTEPVQIHYNNGATNGSIISSLILDQYTLKSGDIGVLIDTNTGLITGVSEFSRDINNNAIYTTSGNLYNQYVNSGYFFKLDPNSTYDTAQITITGFAEDPQIFYDYLYF